MLKNIIVDNSLTTTELTLLGYILKEEEKT